MEIECLKYDIDSKQVCYSTYVRRRYAQLPSQPAKEEVENIK